jgi:hypothetical protein
MKDGAQLAVDEIKTRQRKAAVIPHHQIHSNAAVWAICVLADIRRLAPH